MNIHSLNVNQNDILLDNSTVLKIKIKPFCFIIIIINIIAYFIVFITNRINDEKWECSLFKLGARHTPSIVYNYEIYRLITSVFLHSNISHLILNNISLILIGFKVENILGSAKTIGIYFLSGLFANTISTIVNINGISVGASGAIYGRYNLH